MGVKGGKKRGTILPEDELAAYCPDLAEWPRQWRYEERDAVFGQQIVACFTPFLQHLLNSGLSPKTLRKHRDNLWLLGGELMRALWEKPGLRKQRAAEVITSVLDDDGGPRLSSHASEEAQRSFDSTCHKYHRFLQEHPSTG